MKRSILLVMICLTTTFAFTDGDKTKLDFFDISGPTVGEQLTVVDGGGSMALSLASKYIPVRKASAGTLAIGTPLHVVSYNVAGYIEVEAADADTPSLMPCDGLAKDEVTNSSTVRMQISGDFNTFNTSSFSVGDMLYVSTTAGQLTNTRPTGSAEVQLIGYVGRSNINNGEIIIGGAGRSNDIPNIADGYVWVGNSSSIPTATDSSGWDKNSSDDYSNPMTTQGDTTYGGASGSPTRLAAGSAGYIYRMNSGGTAPEWSGSLTNLSIVLGSTPSTTDGELTHNATTDALVKGDGSTTITYSHDGGTATLTNKTMAAGSNSFTGFPYELCVAASDETTDLTTGTAKVTFRSPRAFTLTEQSERALTPLLLGQR